MKLTVSLAIAQSLLWGATAALDSYCVDGIRTDLADFVFAGTNVSDYWGNICTNDLTVTSIWAAVKTYCTQKQIHDGEEMLSEYCMEYGFVTLTPYANVLPLLTDDFVASLQIVEYEDMDPTIVWNNSVLLSKQFFVAGEKTVVRCHGLSEVFPTNVLPEILRPKLHPRFAIRASPLVLSSLNNFTDPLLDGVSTAFGARFFWSAWQTDS